ncbi:MAG: amidohydrolase family protein [Anaerolineae bacterium]
MTRYLIKGGIVVTMDPERRILYDGAVIVEGNRIVFVGDAADLDESLEVDEVIDAGGHFVIPGMLNAHNHLYSMLTRYMKIPLGEIEGQPFGIRLTRWWWPKIEETATEEDAYWGAMLGGAEMLRRGCTCTADLLEAPNAIPGGLKRVAEALETLGMRGVLSFEASERISAENGQLGLEENANLARAYNDKPDSLITGWIGVHTPFSSSPEYLQQARALADDLGVGIQIHIAQSKYEVEYIRQKFGAKGSVYHLNNIGFLRPDLVAGHCIYVDEGELDLLAEHDVKISFNIKSNANGANGLAPIPEMLERGITVGMGVDGINVLDMFELMVHTAYHVRLGYLTRSLLPSQRVFEMATIDGAKVLQKEEELGSLEVGKKADIVLIKYAGKPHLNPVGDIYGAVAFGARGTDVELVMVDGKVVVRDGDLQNVDTEELVAQAVEQSKRYKARIDEMPVSPIWDLPTA